MRSFLFFVLTVWITSACSPSKEEQAKLIAEGKELVSANDCKTCHHPTNRIIGPAHLDVAKKYETSDANISMLADRIIKGGSGNWGEQPMNPHPDLSKE